MTVLLEIENLAVDTHSEAIVHPTSLSVRAGEPFTILGETGSGKSLLAQAIMGILPLGLGAQGSIRLAGRDIGALPDRDRRALWGRDIAVLPQEPWRALDPTMRALPQVAEGYRLIGGENRDAAQVSARRALQAVGLEGAEAKLPHQLSGGMAQRVAFAAAMAGGASFMIADEPTKGLDAERRDETVDLLLSGMGPAGGLLTITHDIAVARRLGGRLAVMRDGRIVEEGAAGEVLRAPRHAYTQALIAADPENWPVRSAPTADGVAILKAGGLAKARGDRALFADRSFDIVPGEIVGMVGPSGCGKSTFGDVLLGLVRPDAGAVWRDPKAKPVRFQKLYQDPPAAFSRFATLRTALADLVALHGLDQARIGPLMNRLRLAHDLLDRRPDQISGGELQRFALLRVLLLDPVFLFADEPTSRLDLVTQKEIVDLLVELSRERGMAVLIVSHDRVLVGKIADRVIEMGEVSDSHERRNHQDRVAAMSAQ